MKKGRKLTNHGVPRGPKGNFRQRGGKQKRRVVKKHHRWLLETYPQKGDVWFKGCHNVYSMVGNAPPEWMPREYARRMTSKGVAA